MAEVQKFIRTRLSLFIPMTTSSLNTNEYQRDMVAATLNERYDSVDLIPRETYTTEMRQLILILTL